jgi:hypothetical protein
MAKFSKKVMGKEVGDAKVYASPHTMTGKAGVQMKQVKDPNTLSQKQQGPRTGSPRVSSGDPAADDVKKTGIKMRGAGAATKGVMSRGPMA